MTALKMQDEDRIKPRQVGDAIPEIKTLDPGLGAYHFGDLPKIVEFAKLMAQAGPMLPKHAQGNAGICLALVMRATHWGLDPFGLAEESYQAKDGGPVAFQAKVFTAVARKAGIVIKYRYEGELKILDEPVKSYKGNEIAKRRAVGNLKCIAYASDGGELLEYETPELDQITIKNSPMWHNDPRQQLAYYAGRGWMRRYRADLMMGAYSDDEVEQFERRRMRDVTPRQGGFAQMIEQARQEAAQEPKEADPSPTPQEADQTHHEAAQEGQDANGDTSSPDTSPVFEEGAEAARAGAERSACPYKDDVESAIAWLDGHDSITEAEDDQ
jgi:hypothetical protein